MRQREREDRRSGRPSGAGCLEGGSVTRPVGVAGVGLGQMDPVLLVKVDQLGVPGLRRVGQISGGASGIVLETTFVVSQVWAGGFADFSGHR